VVNRDERAPLLGVASSPEGGERSGETMAKDEKRWSVRGCWSSDLTTVNECKERALTPRMQTKARLVPCRAIRLWPVRRSSVA
jgi:hypothetical protein